MTTIVPLPLALLISAARFSDWATDRNLVPAGPKAELDTYVGYYEPSAMSHEALDGNTDFQRKCAMPPTRSWRR
jgi:hypothetical protein